MGLIEAASTETIDCESTTAIALLRLDRATDPLIPRVSATMRLLRANEARGGSTQQQARLIKIKAGQEMAAVDTLIDRQRQHSSHRARDVDDAE